MTEQWRPITGFEHYEVSSLGRVRSWVNTKHRRRTEPLILAAPPCHPGYPIVLLRGNTAPWKPAKCFVHRLVLEAFVGPAPAGAVACHHPDRTRTNCRLENLRWGSYRDNEADKVLQGVPRGPGKPTHCKNGHLLTADNVYIRKNARGSYRLCRLCSTVKQRRYRAEHPLS